MGSVEGEIRKMTDLEISTLRENTRLREANEHLQAAIRGAYGMATAALGEQHILGQYNGGDVIPRAAVAEAVAEWRALIKTLKPKPVEIRLDGSPKNVVDIHSP